MSPIEPAMRQQRLLYTGT